MISLLPSASKIILFYLMVACLIIAPQPLPAATFSTRSNEIQVCSNSEIITWADGADKPITDTQLTFTYNHDNCPAWFTKRLVTMLIKRATTIWSECGIPSRVILLRTATVPDHNPIVVQWSEKESRGNFALANITQRTLSLSPKGFGLLRQRNPQYDASQTLQMAISHEMGHFFGLMAHSRRCVDVMSYYFNNKGETCYTRNPGGMTKGIEYRSTLPTACDIERCRMINGKPPLPNGTITLH